MPFKKVRVETKPRGPLGKVRHYFKKVFVGEKEKNTTKTYVHFKETTDPASKLAAIAAVIMTKGKRSVTKTEDKYYTELVMTNDINKANKLYKKLINLINTNNKNRAKRKK